MNKLASRCKRALIASTLLGLMAACATMVDVSGRFPAKVPAAAELRTIAVAGFEGSGGDRFAAALEAHLASLRFDDKPYFTLMGGTRDRVVDSASAIRYGSNTGAAAVYFGRMDAVTQSTSVRQKRLGDCVERKKDGTCKRRYEYSVTCEERKLTLTVLPKTVKVATGAIVYSKESIGSAKTSHCPGSSGQSDAELIAIAEKTVLAAISEDVAPQNRSMKAKISKDADGLGEADAASFNQAVDAMGAGNMPAACETWSQIDQAVAGHRPTLFNLGVCAEVDGRYQDALAHYESARAEPAVGEADDSDTMQQTLSAVTSMMGSDIRADTDIAVTRVRELISAEGELDEADQKRAAAIAAGRQKLAEQTAAAEQQRASEAAAAEKAEAAANAAAAEQKKNLTDKYGQSAADAIIKGEIAKGMSKDAVLAARGKPLAKEVLGPTEEIWTYDAARVIFADGKVSYVGK